MRRSLAILVVAIACTLAPAAAWAQTLATGPSITASAQVNAERFVDNQDVGQYTRPVNLNQLGINYSDCIEDMVLNFSVTLAGFNDNDNMQVWATYNGDCTSDVTRGIGTTAPTCWLVNQGLTLPNAESAYTYSFPVPVRALLAPEGGIPPAGTLVGDQGPEACTHQASFAAVPITVWFLPLLPGGQEDTAGTAYQYPTISADLVGPPAPTGVSIADGDTLFVVNWTPNTDGDTQGYDVFIDPPLGSHPEAGVESSHVLYCPDSGVSTTTTIDDGGDDAEDATVVSTVSSVESSDACVYINGGGTVPTGTGGAVCSSIVLGAPPVFTVGATLETLTDDAGDLLEPDASGVEVGTGGIASIPCANLAGASCSADAGAFSNTGNPSVTGLSGSTLTIGGLTNGVTYSVVVSAIDGSGNVGPQSSPQQCDYPAPVNDFFKTYRLDGGGAGGGFCTLEAVGAPTGASVFSMGFGALAFGLARRRRKRGRK
jgi:hypothetical protein